jgi:broad specificity phosphatase PhoE
LEGTTLYFIRHGEILANVEKRWHGSTDSELNELGLQQAQRLGEYLRSSNSGISAIYTSPLKRTYRTAELVGSPMGIKPHSVSELVEFGIGELENTPYEVLSEEVGFLDEIAADIHYAPPGGESVNQVAERMVSAIKRIAASHPGDEVAIVSHGAAIGIALAQLMDGAPFPFYQYHMDNTGLSKFIYADNIELVFFNKVDHLLQKAC